MPFSIENYSFQGCFVYYLYTFRQKVRVKVYIAIRIITTTSPFCQESIIFNTQFIIFNTEFIILFTEFIILNTEFIIFTTKTIIFTTKTIISWHLPAVTKRQRLVMRVLVSASLLNDVSASLCECSSSIDGKQHSSAIVI